MGSMLLCSFYTVRPVAVLQFTQALLFIQLGCFDFVHASTACEMQQLAC